MNHIQCYVYLFSMLYHTTLHIRIFTIILSLNLSPTYLIIESMYSIRYPCHDRTEQTYKHEVVKGVQGYRRVGLNYSIQMYTVYKKEYRI